MIFVVLLSCDEQTLQCLESAERAYLALNQHIRETSGYVLSQPIRNPSIEMPSVPDSNTTEAQRAFWEAAETWKAKCLEASGMTALSETTHIWSKWLDISDTQELNAVLSETLDYTRTHPDRIPPNTVALIGAASMQCSQVKQENMTVGWVTTR